MTKIAHPTTSHQLQKVADFLTSATGYHREQQRQEREPLDPVFALQRQALYGYVQAITKRGRMVALLGQNQGFERIHAVAALRLRAESATRSRLNTSVAVRQQSPSSQPPITGHSDESISAHAGFAKALALLAFHHTVPVSPVTGASPLPTASRRLPETSGPFLSFIVEREAEDTGYMRTEVKRIALPTSLIDRFRGQVDRHDLDNSANIRLRLYDPRFIPLNRHVYGPFWSAMSASHDLLTARPHEQTRDTTSLFDDTTLGHLIAMTHLAHEPSAVLSISSPNCPSARTILWHTPPVISKTATDAELARDWTYDLFTEPDLPEHELEAFRHRLGPLDPLQPRPADREFHDDRYLTDHQRSLDIGSRLDFNTLSL